MDKDGKKRTNEKMSKGKKILMFLGILIGGPIAVAFVGAAIVLPVWSAIWGIINYKSVASPIFYLIINIVGVIFIVGIVLLVSIAIINSIEGRKTSRTQKYEDELEDEPDKILTLEEVRRRTERYETINSKYNKGIMNSISLAAFAYVIIGIFWNQLDFGYLPPIIKYLLIGTNLVIIIVFFGIVLFVIKNSFNLKAIQESLISFNQNNENLEQLNYDKEKEQMKNQYKIVRRKEEHVSLLKRVFPAFYLSELFLVLMVIINSVI